MGSLQFGAKQAISNCLKVRCGERVVVVTDRQTRRVADALVDEIKEVGGSSELFVMEDFGPRPKDGNNPLKFPKEIESSFLQATASIFAAQGRPGEFPSFRKPLGDLANRLRLRHAHMISITEEIMCKGMSADHAAIRELSTSLHCMVYRAKEAHITTPAGSDFTVNFSRDYRWVVFDGDIKPGRWQNLPAGEIFTAPIDAEGLVVVDGCLGDYFVEKYGDISKTPLSYELSRGRCVKGSVRCANEVLKRDFEEYTFKTDENSDRLGEFAVGTNIGLTELIGNLLQDEKFPGVHIALGNPYPDRTGADWSSRAHNDGVLRDATLTIDGKTIVSAGKFPEKFEV